MTLSVELREHDARQARNLMTRFPGAASPRPRIMEPVDGTDPSFQLYQSCALPLSYTGVVSTARVELAPSASEADTLSIKLCGDRSFTASCFCVQRSCPFGNGSWDTENADSQAHC